MISTKEVAIGKRINISKLTRTGPVSISEAGRFRPAADISLVTQAEPTLPRARTRPKVGWITRVGVAAAATGALLGGIDTRGHSDSSSSLRADMSTSTSLDVKHVANEIRIEQAEVGSRGSRTDTVSKVARSRIVEAGIQNPTRNDILQITTAIGYLTPTVSNLDVVTPEQVLNVPDESSIRTTIQASHGQSQNAELNMEAKTVQAAIETEGYNNARDEAGVLMSRLARLAESNGSESSVTSGAVPAPATDVARPSETRIATPTSPTKTPETPGTTSSSHHDKPAAPSEPLPLWLTLLAGGLGTAALTTVGTAAWRREAVHYPLPSWNQIFEKLRVHNTLIALNEDASREKLSGRAFLKAYDRIFSHPLTSEQEKLGANQSEGLPLNTFRTRYMSEIIRMCEMFHIDQEAISDRVRMLDEAALSSSEPHEPIFEFKVIGHNDGPGEKKYTVDTGLFRFKT